MTWCLRAWSAPRLVWITMATALLVSGCAVPSRAPELAGQPRNAWSGRLALRVDQQQSQSFSAGFELKGDAQTGQLSLYSPLGGTIAQLIWSPGDARLRADGKESRFESLEALTLQATGTALPVASIFQWLAGENARVAGWDADLRELPDGRLVARRTQPPPAVEMRLILER